MITNDRQYRISKSELEKMRASLASLQNSESADVLTLEKKLYSNAFAGQIEELNRKVTDYAELKSSKEVNFKSVGLDSLPETLIKVRIASGLSQKELAALVGTREQQIQRWEATTYMTASYENILKVSNALKLNVVSEGAVFSEPELVSKLKTFLNKWIKEPFSRNLFSAEILSGFDAEDSSLSSLSILRMLDQVSRMFECSLSGLIQKIDSNAPLSSNVLAYARFKTPKAISITKFESQALYSNYIAQLSSQCYRKKEKTELISDPIVLNRLIVDLYGAFDFAGVLDFCWSKGVIVIPMSESGSFHGAVWGVGDKIVITLKQRKRYSSIWLFDLLHELRHGIDFAEQGWFAYLEEHPIDVSRHDSEEEQNANLFAEDAIFGGRSDEIEELVVALADGSVEAVKSAVKTVAAQERVSLGALANHMAHRMEEDGITNWWGTAMNLQKESIDEDPYLLAVEKFYQNIDLSSLNPLDRDVLKRAVRREDNYGKN